MSEKKNLMINCDVCDARNAKEEYLSGYEQIMINTDLLLVSAESRGILERLPAVCNTDNTLEVDDNVNLIFQNGNSEISSASAFPVNSILAVNGNLIVHSGTSRKVLETLRAINVTGSLLCPVSLLTCIKDLYVTGEIKAYPDDCIVLSSIFTPDMYFHLRAKEGQKYYAEQEIRLTDSDINLAVLRNKKVQFISPRFFVPAEKASDALELFDETASMEIVPHGYVFVGEDEELNQKLLKKYGKRLYFRGDLDLTEENTPLLSQLEKLYVLGTLSVPENLKDSFSQIDVECSSVKIVKEEKRRILENRPRIILDSNILTSSPQGILVRNCAILTIDVNITPREILDQIEIINCARVDCTENQKSAVYQKSINVSQIGSRKENGEPGGMLGILLNLPATKMINADKYVL